MSRTALMLGGPMDGQLLAVRDAGPFITIAQLDVDSLSASFDQVSPLTSVPTKRIYYAPRSIKFFHHVILTFAPDSMSDAQLERFAVKHVLSDKAKGALL